MRRHPSHAHRLGRRGRARPANIAIEVLEARSLLATISVTGTSDAVAVDGAVSLREAILSNNNGTAVNADVVPVGSFGTNDRIEFRIPGTGVHTIQPAAPLPTIAKPVIIDGYSQPNSSPNTNGPGQADNAVLLIELDGSTAHGDGLTLNHDCTVQGLVINRFSGAGIKMSGSSRNLIQGNLLGTNAAGMAASGNGSGVSIDDSGVNTVGGTTAAARNVISGNSVSGISINASTQILVEGNFIGTDAAGTGSLQSTFNGVGIGSGAAGITVGGTTAAARNVISGNRGQGVDLTGSSTKDNLIQGNFIGTDVTGIAALGNSQGFEIDNSTDNTIGGAAAGAGNLISGNRIEGMLLSNAAGTLVQGNSIGIAANGSALGNAEAGVYVDFAQNITVQQNIIAFNGTSGGTDDVAGVVVDANPTSTDVTGNRISRNSIFSNFGLGIDLGDDGVTFNHTGGSSTGPNLFQNFPVITAVSTSGSGTTITGTLNGKANTAYHLEFFANAAADPSGFGEGQMFLGALDNVMTNGSGNASFTTPVAALPTGQTAVTATATDPAGNTSEFSQAKQATQSPGAAADLSIAVAAPDTVRIGQLLTYTVTVTNHGPDAASGVSVRDSLPDGVTFVSATSSQGSIPTRSGGVVTAALGSVADGGRATVTIVVRPTVWGTLTDSASVSGAESDPNSVNNGPGPDNPAATANTTVPLPSAELFVLILAPDTVQLGQTVTYKVNVTNDGPDPATNVILDDALPGGVTFVSAAASQGPTPAVSSGFVSAAIGNLAVGASATMTIVVRTTSAGILQDSASTIASDSDLLSPDSMAIETTTVVPPPSADLSVELYTSAGFPQDIVRVGEPLTLTIIVTNNGPDPATGVVVRESLSASESFVSATPNQGSTPSRSGLVVTSALGDLAVHSSATVTIVVRPTAVGTLTNSASVTGTRPDPNLTNNGPGPDNPAATAITMVSPASADLFLELAASPDRVRVDRPLTLTITVTNFGPDPATNVMVREFLSVFEAFTSASASQGPRPVRNGEVVTATLGRLAVGASATVTITVMPVIAGLLGNDAEVTGAEDDPDPLNNSTSVMTPVFAHAADLSVTLGAPSTVVVNRHLTYTATVTNLGPEVATGVNLYVNPPLHTELVSTTASQGPAPALVPNTDSIGSDLGALAPHASATITVVVRPMRTGTIYGSAGNFASVVDPAQSNNGAYATTMVITRKQSSIIGTTTLYGILLNRGPEPAGLRFWVRALAAGGSLRQVARGIAFSREHFALRGRPMPSEIRTALRDARRAAFG
jgi:uncharacterized repeat protein (TIGR01451 family)